MSDDKEKTYTISLCKIKEANLDFMAKLFAWSQEYLDEKYDEGQAKGYVRNAPDGTYELFAEIKDE